MSRTCLVLVHLDPTDTSGEPYRVVDPRKPQLSVLDLGVTRGDGIFESISVINGAPHALNAHLHRFISSARLLDFPDPDAQLWQRCVVAAINGLDPVPEAAVRMVLTRGVEGQSIPTGWVYAAPLPDFGRVRSEGVRVVTLDRGYRSDVATTSPWLLTGAKTLSYAVNRAALREAARRDADDVVFVSSDGFVLEGPTSSVLVRRGSGLSSPGKDMGILEGTTQGDVFEWAAKQGIPTSTEMITVAELAASDAAWLVSSGRHAVPIRSINGVSHPVDVPLTEQINSFLMGDRGEPSPQRPQ